MEEQIISAIQIAWDPTSDQNLKRQAFEYVNQLRQEPQAWHPCLSIFTHLPRHSEVVRVFSLEIVNNALQRGIVDIQGLNVVKEQLMEYLRKAYGADGSETVPDTASIENKIAQTITYLFSSFYANGWETCINDLLQLTTTQSGARDNLLGTVFYLRVINAIHDEIGDQLLSRSQPEQERANKLKDLVRDRDVQNIASSWQEILGNIAMQNAIVAELCLRAIGKWVSWIDISLVVNQQMLQLLFQHLQLAQRTNLEGSSEQKARDAAVDVFTEIIAKKMSPGDKVNLITFLDLENVVSQLVACPPLAARNSSTYDVDLAETIAKLVNTTVQDIVRVLENETHSSEIWQKAERMLQSFLPHLLRFFSDEYDEVCSNVLPAMQDVLAFLRHAMQGEQFATQRAVMLTPILSAIFAKMRYDDTSSWGEEEDRTDEAEFQDLRKKLGALQQAIASTDEQLFMDAVAGLVMDTFTNLQNRDAQVNWRDLDLALHEMYLLGELAVKSGGLYQKSKPVSPAAERLTRMMLLMVQTDIGSFAHPAVQLQYMEICVRYNAFFDKHNDYIQTVLQNFLRLAHHSNLKVKYRSWYLLQRFVRQQRQNVGAAAEAVVSNLQDLLMVKAEIPTDDNDDDMSSEEDATDSAFTSQLYLFEAVGWVVSSSSVPANQQIQLLQSVMQPLFEDIEKSLIAAGSGNEQAILQVHHDIMALGNIARGYYDWPGTNPTATGFNAPQQVRDAFSRISEATLLALDSLKSSFDIRTAARFAFSRLIGMVGSQMMQQLPKWVEGLLTESASRDEMAQLLRLLDQVTFGFKSDVSNFLDSLFTGLLQRIFASLSAGTSGTDDEIELAELKREYLNFLLVILGNDLGGILVSSANQPMFENVIASIEHFAKDVEDFPTGKMAFILLSKMSAVWGGPDVVTSSAPTTQLPSTNANGLNGSTDVVLPGFKIFMIQRFSPLCWSLPSNPGFNAKDAQGRQVLTEAAGLQKAIFSKTGDEYLTWLRENELKSLVGMNDAMVEEYLAKFVSSDVKAWKQFFVKFVSQGGNT